MRILHIAADYPDPLEPRKPRAISNLLELAPEHEHRVVSINRMNWRGSIHAIDFADSCGSHNRAVVYPGMPYGLRFQKYLGDLAEWLIEDCKAAGFVPDLVHAHKMTVEGTAGSKVAAAFGVPYALTIQGNTDIKILNARRDLHPLFRKTWHGASVVYPFAVWALRAIEEKLGAREDNTYVIPVPGPADSMMEPKVVDDPVFRTAFHLQWSQLKNLPNLIRAVGQASKEVPDISLEIIGGGDATQFSICSDLAAKEAPGKVRFLGPVPNHQIQTLFHESVAFALVGFRESFGMVYSEALLAGTPCLFPRGQAIDGYFEEGGFVLGAYAKDVNSIAEGLVRLVKDQAGFKGRLAEAMKNGDLKILTQASIQEKYRTGLARAVPGKA